MIDTTRQPVATTPAHWSLLSALALLAACTLPPRRAGIDAVDALVAERVASGVVTPAGERDEAALRAQLDALRAGELTLARAVGLALLNNPRVRAEYAALGIARGDLIEASRPSNPRLGVLRERADGNRSTTQSVSRNFTEALLLGTRTRIGEAEYVRVQRLVADAVLRLASEVETAWFEAVGAVQIAQMRAAIAKAAGLSAELATRMHAAGNLARLPLLVEQGAASQAAIESRRAQAQARAARSRLLGLLGLGSAATVELPAWLAAPPALALDAAALATAARAQRLDLSALERERALRADALELARKWRWLGSLELGVERETAGGEVRVRGLEASIELPIFHQGQAAIARAQAELEAADARLTELAIAIEHEVMVAGDRTESLRQLAQDYRERLLPQREGIVDATQREYNYMLTGAFELLRARQEQYAAYQEYLETVRDYWIARGELRRAVGGRLPGDEAMPEATVGVEAVLPKSGESEK
ncbi:MAG: TolC family protein [Xanthomonadales bacterium]|nr:TolC family protein [Xanthomonadales bacterium]